MPAFSERRYHPSSKPHIFKEKGIWLVSFNQARWTHTDFCNYMEARNLAFVLNHPPFKRSLLKESAWNF